MSEFTNHSEKRSNALTNYMFGLIAGKDGTELIKQYEILTENYIPSDILPIFDNLFKANIDIEKIKIASNKLFNILYKAFNNYPAAIVKEKTYLHYLILDNNEIKKQLNNIKPSIKKINKVVDKVTINVLQGQFVDLLKIDTHYTSKENVLFPYFENNFENSDCLKLMWSFHDDIRTNIKQCIELLTENNFELKEFNRVSAKVFFNISTIIFREEKVLFPVIFETFKQEDIDIMQYENKDIGFAFIESTDVEYTKPKKQIPENNETIHLETGNLSLKQLELIFKHLPVDITFVDKDDKVKFYSDPPHRIFPRTISIIGRNVQNCHPPESIDIVNRIVSAFKSGEKNEASFWIKMNNKFILIKYFAVRNASNNYEGTLEVSQEVSDIRELKGEKRLLDWGI